MSRIECYVDRVELQGDYGLVTGVCATCTKCGHETESYGTGQGSVDRCMALMREECPEGENNRYDE